MTLDPVDHAALARDSKPIPRNSPHRTQARVEPVRIDVATEEQLDNLRYEMFEVKMRLNEVIVALNMHNAYLNDFRSRFSSLLAHRWYRFIIWVWPFGLPEYKRHKLIPVFIVRDRKPRMR